MQAVLRTVYDCLPPPAFAGSDLPCGGGRLSSSAVVRESQHFHVSSVETEDRISFLPDCLRRNIISRLPIRDAVRTKILSRRWCNDWASTPLYLDDAHLVRMSEKERIQRVSRVLLEHPGPVQCIRFALTSFEHCRDALILWLSILAKKHVVDLVLLNKPLPIDLELPISLLMQCSSLSQLSLDFFHIPTIVDHRDCFPELRHLRLYCVAMDSTDLSNLLRLSPILESLSLIANYSMPDVIYVHSHQKLSSIVLWLSDVRELSIGDSSALKRVILWNPFSVSKMTIKISNAQNLESLGYLEPGVQTLVINNVRIQAGTKVKPHTVVPSVNILGCRLSFGDKKQSNMLLAFLGCFPHVETLHVQSVKATERSGKFNLTSLLDKADGIKCVDDNIKKLFFHQFHGERSELAFLKFIWRNARSLEQLVIILSEECLERVDETQSKLIELGGSVRASEQPRLLVIGIDIPMVFEMACDTSLRDPFCCMDDFEPSTPDEVAEQVGMMVKGVAPTVELSSGYMMPMVGLALGPGLPNDKAWIRDLINHALQIGYRHFDLSGNLGMVANIGNAFAEACQNEIVKREDLFISFKVSLDHSCNVIQDCKHTLGILGLEYVDLGLVDDPLASFESPDVYGVVLKRLSLLDLFEA